MSKKKNAVLRPSGEVPTVVEPTLLAVLQPIASGGEENLAGADVMVVAGEFAELADEKARLEEQLKALKKRMDVREEWLLERMAEGGMQKITVKGRTLYQIQDLIVSKGKGVDTESLVARLEEVGLGDLVSETYSAQTLKAAVKEARSRAAEAGFSGEAAFCTRCSRFFDAALASYDCAYCLGQEEVAPRELPLARVVDGVVASLHQMLYIEPITKLGCRQA